MAQNKNIQKLELTWIGKGEEPKLEPRILIENPVYSYGDPNTENMLIHGDNLLALKALEYDYAGKVKCIYIDPPYNTGKAFEHYDDGIEHSLWLGLMSQRLKLLRNLMSDDGTIWISIDDAEMAYLMVLGYEIFGKSNLLACLPTIMNLKGNQDQFGFAGTHEYTIVFSKNKSNVKFNEFAIDEDEFNEEWQSDDIGPFKKGAPMRATGNEAKREDRPFMFYPILMKNDSLYAISREEFESLYDSSLKTFNDDFLNSLINKYQSQGFDVILPKVDENQYGRWRWGYNDDNINRLSYDVIVNKTKNNITLYKKQRPELGELPTKKPKSIFYKPEYSSGNGTAQVKKLFGFKAFDYPKPEDLIKDIIHIASNPDDLVLDSFLGSGTTAAVAQKMGRKYIGIELGEHAITHCYPRLKQVVDGEQGGISKAVNWQGGGGFKFYTLAPSLLKKDKFDHWIMSDEYNADMLAAAMAKQEGFKYNPSETEFWKQGHSSEQDFIFTTTQFMTVQQLEAIADDMQEGESLLICCKAFQPECTNKYANITIKKIPQLLLDRCEFGKDDYSLNIVNIPQDDNQEDYNVEDEIENEEEVVDTNTQDNIQKSLFD